MDSLVAACAPATAALQERRMVASSNQNYVWRGLLLEMAFEAKILVPLHQHFVVHSSVWVVAGRAAFAHRFVFEHERPALRDVAFGTGFVLGSHGERSSDGRRSLMGIMAIAATHLAMRDWMGVWQVETAFHLQMAVETHLRRSLGINNSVSRATTLNVQTARAMATLAANVLRMDTVCLEPCVGGCRKILVNLRMAFGTGGGPDKLSAGNFRRDNDNSIDCDA
jgi:hypothetical protein